MSSEYLVSLYHKQKGRFFYSGLPFQPNGESDWLVSLERRNINVTYTKTNVVLICAEFNAIDRGNTGWSRDKVDFVRSLLR